MKGPVILKVGGSLLTQKGEDRPSLNREGLNRIAGEVARGYRGRNSQTPLILVHGAGSYGHPIVKKYGINRGCRSDIHAFGFAETQWLQNELNGHVVRALQKEGIPAIPVQASAFAVMETKKWVVPLEGVRPEIEIHDLIWMPLDAVKGFLSLGMVPVLYGVPAYDRKQGCSILSGDQIVPYLSRELGGERIIEATDVPGVYTRDPKRDPEAELIRRASSLTEVFDFLGASTHTDVTGGIRGKVLELFRILGGSGVKAEFISGEVEGNIERALRGEEGLGTLIHLK
jgi:isopentenyl phosphate kinase